MTLNHSIGFTPFFLNYKSEAVLPTDLDYGAPRVTAFDPERAEESQREAVDLLEEAQEIAVLRSARYQQTVRRYHERRIRGRTLEVGDMVLWRAMSTNDKNTLSLPWEGPYTITEVV